jgi:iron complex outermembrane recepter protein
MRRAGLTALRVLGCAWLLTTAARAQQGGALLEEVLVTAEKKSAAESAQTVPISIAAYSGKQVEAMFAISLTDVGLSTPNVSLTAIPTFPGVANFVIRGMGTVGQSIPSADPAVGVFIDGIALGTIYGVVTDLFDLESIEILRGPQGTLFGRNVTGGAILLRSKRPTEEFEGSVRATVGSYSQRDLALTLSGPISENWGAKIAVLRKDHDDYWDNRLLGVRQGDSQTLLVRPALTFKRGAFDATAIVEYGKMEGDGLSAITWWADGAQVVDPYADRVSLQDTIGYSNLKWSSGSLEANWDLWEGQLTAVLGLRDLEQRMESDIDGYSGDRFEFAPGTRLDQDQQSIELRWSGDLGERVTLTTGLYGFQQEYTYAERRFLNRAVDRRGVSTITHDTQGVFAQADWRIAEKFTLTIGGRYTNEEKDAEIGVIGDPSATGDCATTPPPFSPTTPALSDCVPALVDNKSWSNFGPKIGANWAITEDVMVYADYSRGFRSGGYNVRFTDLTYITNPASPSSTPGPYNEEVVDAVEIGIKSTFFEGKARVNAAMFQNQYDDLQRTALNAAGGQEILNAASARIQGFELEAIVAVTEKFVLQAGLGLIDAEYEEFQTAETATGLPADQLRFVLVPDLKYNVAATYDWRAGKSSALTARLAYSYVDETFSDDFNRARQADYGLLDASLTFESDNGLKVSLFGKNVSDEVYYDFGTNFSTSALSVQSFWLTPPRTYGLEATYSF